MPMAMKDKIEEFRKACARFAHDYHIANTDTLSHNTKWGSSAKELEEKLKKLGIILPNKLYYEYKFPGNLQNFEFFEKTRVLHSFILIYENYLEEFMRDDSKTALLYDTAQTNLATFFGFCISLALSDIKDLETLYKQTYQQSIQKLYEIAEQIRQLNPELQIIQNYKNIDFVAGAIYGFAPKEIDFFIKLQERRKTRDFEYERSGKDEELNHANNNMRKISAFTQTSITYFISPETSDEIIKAIQQFQRNTKQTFNNR